MHVAGPVALAAAPRWQGGADNGKCPDPAAEASAFRVGPSGVPRPPEIVTETTNLTCEGP